MTQLLIAFASGALCASVVLIAFGMVLDKRRTEADEPMSDYTPARTKIWRD